ncbi:MAG: rRNA maturation RNase YbeY [Melioribacteraceae bacterium]|nr:rRNA maturation RNase YbeY [Melioribacteraceae bacterium]MCF8264939.1 rRNA maturation RNase YbeY [Melioribacteraceae bacterium]MCF8413645.1 rRNA maturation RNase YbeY [Melioribacteraceae bacterium]
MKFLEVISEDLFRVDEPQVHNLVENLSKELDFSVFSLQINIVSSQSIIKINGDFLNHNYSTDIVTLNYSGSDSCLEGQLYISYDDARENSVRFGCEIHTEIARLIIHGILHLLGYDDQDEDDKKEMKLKENHLVNKLGNIVNFNLVKDDR